MSGDEPYAYLKLLGQLRPPRLLEKAIKFTIDRRIRSQKARFKEVQSVERIGIGDVIGLETTTKTLFASGLYSHNSHPNINIRSLTRECAVAIYHRDYWLPVRAHELPSPAGEVIFDIAVNNGKARAAKWLQEALGVTVDGFIGPRTLEAAEKADPAALAKALLARRAAFYRSIARGGRAKFLAGWLNRNEALRKFAGVMAVVLLGMLNLGCATTRSPQIVTWTYCGEQKQVEMRPAGIRELWAYLKAKF